MTTTQDPTATPPAVSALHEALAVSHVTAGDVAAALGVPIGTFNDWRYGRRTMPAEMLARASMILLRRAAEMRRAAEHFADLVTAGEDAAAA